MTVPGISTIVVVGAGTMGHQIALCAALAGYRVICTDVAPEALRKAQEFAERYLPERVAKGRITEEVAGQARTNLSFTASLEEAVSEADFVLEAATEKLDLKRELYSRLDQLAPRRAILATNSSYIVSSKIASATTRPDKVCNMHFFNPALAMKLVEVVKGPHVSEETAQIAVSLAESLGKIPVLLQKEMWGFLVNRIFTAILQEAFYLYDMGVASYEDIDTAVVNALGHPMGPFRLVDMTGIDLNYYRNMERYRETGDPAAKPSPTIVEKFARGEWGRKTGKGFYDYPPDR